MAEIICKECGKTCASLRGWKQHMSATHAGYSDQDLIDVAGGDSASEAPESTKARMNKFASTLSGGEASTEQRLGDNAVTGTLPLPTPGERRVRATPKKLKKILGGIPKKILEESGVPLDDEDRDAMDEAGEFLADIFGIEFSVPESKVTVQSRLWALVWVAGVTGLIYVKHRFPFVMKHVLRLFKNKSDNVETETDEMPPADAATSGN